MPLSTMISLYSLSILAGIILVVYAISQQIRKKELSTDGSGGGVSDDLPLPTEEPLNLQFINDSEVSEDPVSSVPGRTPWDRTSSVHAKTGVFSGITASLPEVLKAPFRVFHRKRSAGNVCEPDKPMASGTVVKPKSIGGTPDSTDSE